MPNHTTSLPSSWVGVDKLYLRKEAMALTGREIKANYDDCYDKAYYAWNGFLPYADRDLRFYLGDQWDEAEKRELFQEGRSTFVFNRIRPNINMVSGYQRKHRHSSVVVPVEASDQQTSDQLTKLLLYVFQYGDFYECISDCFKGALITGWNLMSLWMDYRTDPLNGDLMCGREPYNGFITDPYFSKLDLSDCAYLIRRKYISLAQGQSLLPEYKKELDILYNIGWERDDKFSWLPYQQQPNGQKMLAYNEYWEQGWEPQKFLYNVATGETFEYEGEDSDYFLYADPNMTLIEKTMPFVKQHIIVNDEHLHTEKNPYGLNEYPFVPFFCVFQPESSDYILKIQSLVRTMVDPQRESNRRRSQMSDMFESQMNSGWIAEEDSVINPRSLFQTSQGKVVWKKRGAPPNALEKIQPGQIPPSMFQLNDLHDKDIMDVANISQELLGQADSEQDSGLKVMLRQGAALVGLQDIFDNLRYAQELVSRKALKMMQSWTPEKMKRIMNEEPTEQLKKKQTIKFDIAVQEGTLTNTQQQMFFQQLLVLKELGEPVPPGLLAKIAPLQGKTEYMQAMDEFNKQQQQAQSEAAKVEMEKLRVQNELFQSQSISNIANAKERFTRSVANLGLEDERAAKAVEDRADAVLRRAQAAKTLESMDDDRLIKLLELFTQLEEINRQKEADLKADDVAISANAEKQQTLTNEVNNAREI
jgi:hypothetical protein